MKNIIFFSVFSLFIFISCGDNDDNGPIDSDGDGYSINDDCDDTNADVNPDAIEICGDGIDNNCDGKVDEGCAIGDLFAGGVVIYIAPAPTDLDGDGILDRGLICSLSNVETAVEWGCYGTDLPNVPNVIIQGGLDGLGAEIGDGMSNTNNILNDCPTAPAALAARSLGPKWFLPTKTELGQVFNLSFEDVPGLEPFNLYYWVSTEYDAEQAWNQFINLGNLQQGGDGFKSNTYGVRAVRAY